MRTHTDPSTTPINCEVPACWRIAYVSAKLGGEPTMLCFRCYTNARIVLGAGQGARLTYGKRTSFTRLQRLDILLNTVTDQFMRHTLVRLTGRNVAEWMEESDRLKDRMMAIEKALRAERKLAS